MSAAATAKSAYAWAIEYRGPAQYRVNIRRKHWPKIRRTYESLAAAEAEVRTINDQMQLVGKSISEKRIHTYRSAQATTFGDILQERIDAITKKKGPQDTSVYRLRTILEVPFADLQPAHFEYYIEWREDADVSGATIRRELNQISSTLTRAMRRFPGVLMVNPASAKQVDYPPNSEHRNRRLIGDEDERLLAGCRAANRSPFLAPMVEIALETAARQGEIRQLAWSEINFEQRYIYLPKTKTNRPRSVPLTDRVHEILSSYRAYCVKRARRLKVKLPDTVFFTGELEPVSANAVKIAFRKARDAAGITDLRFHDLRHEATSRLFERHGLSMVEVMSVTRHRHSTMTERYTHLFAQEIATKLRASAAQIRLPLSVDEHRFLLEQGESLDMPPEDVMHLLIRQAMQGLPHQGRIDTPPSG